MFAFGRIVFSAKSLRSTCAQTYDRLVYLPLDPGDQPAQFTQHRLSSSLALLSRSLTASAKSPTSTQPTDFTRPTSHYSVLLLPDQTSQR